MIDHFYSWLLALPILLSLPLPFIPNRDNGQWVHAYGIGASIIIFLFSSLAWNVDGIYPLGELVSWLPTLGIHYAVDADGLSMTMVILTTFLLVMASVASITNVSKRPKLYYTMLFVLTTSVLGVFLARDLFLFFLFYELELIPMYLLIAIWGGKNRKYASTKFVLYTLFGSVFLLAAILGLYFYGTSSFADPTTLFLFDSVKSNVGNIAIGGQILLFLSLFIGFSVKLPVVPVHTWLPDAHVEAPTPVSMLLAGVLLKMGAYGMVRLAYDLFPQAAFQLAPWIALLAVINIVYTASVALVQKDIKKIIAYSSVSHMGFVLLGLAAMNEIGFNGAVFVMFAHGIVSAALFMGIGTIYNRTHTRMIPELGGLAEKMPILFYFFLLMAMSSLGLPLLISFASETLVFYGAFTATPFEHVINVLDIWPIVWNMQTVSILSAIGIVIGAAYLLWMIQRVFHGQLSDRWSHLKDAKLSEVFVLGTMASLVIVYGLHPKLITEKFEPDVTQIARQFDVYHQSKPIASLENQEQIVAQTDAEAVYTTGAY